MTLMRRLVAGVRAQWRRDRAQGELDEELRGYLQASVDERVRAGMPYEQAVRSARAAMGSIEAVKDHTRDAGWEATVESAWQDARYALRSLRKTPGFTAAAVLTLALGIGATTAIFNLLDAVIFRSLPVANPGELVVVRGGGQYPAFLAFSRHTDIFVNLFATSGITPLDVEIDGAARERTDVSLVSGSYFATLGIHAAAGRVFTREDDRVPGSHPVAVASYGYWQRRFGRSAAAVGRVVRVSGTPVTIIGVAPPGFFGEQVGAAPDLWIPLTMWGHVVPGRNLLKSPGTGWLQMIGRLRPGAAERGPQILTSAFRNVLTEIFGPQAPEDLRRDMATATVTFEPAGRGLSSIRRQFARPLQLLMAAVVLVLLIACANLASLLLARATARRREIDVRLALGATRARLLRQLLTDSLVLSSVGGVIGIAFAWAAREALLRLISVHGSPLPIAAPVDLRLLAFVAGVVVAAAILFGVAPAWQLLRSDAVTALIGRHQRGQPGGQRLGSLLVMVQVAVSVVLLVGAGLFLRTLANLSEVNLGFAPERLIVVDVDTKAAGYDAAGATAVSRRLLETIEALPTVSAATLSENGVLMGRDSTSDMFRPAGFAARPEGLPRTHWDVVGPGYFSTLGTPLVAGRDFTWRDDAAATLVVAINEELARIFFPGTSAIGRRLLWGEGKAQTAFEVVAVTRDVKQGGPRGEPQLRFYVPYLQLPSARPDWEMASTRLLVRTAAEPASVVPLLRSLVPSIDPKLTIASIDVGRDLVRQTLVRERMIASLLSAFGVLAIVLACIGLYGLIAYHVAQRTTEIGLRMALGAQPRQVLSTAMLTTVVCVAGGIAAGLPLALSGARAARGMLFGLSAIDTPSVAGAACVMVAVGLVAGYIPARRALRIDPAVALRAE